MYFAKMKIVYGNFVNVGKSIFQRFILIYC